MRLRHSYSRNFTSGSTISHIFNFNFKLPILRPRCHIVAHHQIKVLLFFYCTYYFFNYRNNRKIKCLFKLYPLFFYYFTIICYYVSYYFTCCFSCYFPIIFLSFSIKVLFKVFVYYLHLFQQVFATHDFGNSCY